MTLRISLRDKEKVIINGAVLRSRGRTEIAVENKCTVLRGRDIMQPEDATTPACELYFCCQMAYVEPEQRGEYQTRLLNVMRCIFAAPASAEVVEAAMAVAHQAAVGNFYAALADCRHMIAAEEVAAASLADVA